MVSIETDIPDSAQVKDLGEDFVFEDKDEGTDVWGHEQRLSAHSPSGGSNMHSLALPCSAAASNLHGVQKHPRPPMSKWQWTPPRQTF